MNPIPDAIRTYENWFYSNWDSGIDMIVSVTKSIILSTWRIIVHRWSNVVWCFSKHTLFSVSILIIVILLILIYRTLMSDSWWHKLNERIREEEKRAIKEERRENDHKKLD